MGRIQSIFMLTLTLFCFQNCDGGFKSEHVTTLASTDLASATISAGTNLYKMNCAGCHGPIETSSKLGRTAPQITTATQTIPDMSAFKTSLSDTDINNIAAALAFYAPALGSQFTCVDKGNIGASQMLRLSKTQYLNALTDIFGAAVVTSVNSALTGIPDDDTRIGALGMITITNDQISGYMDVALAVAQAVTASDSLTTAIFGACAIGTSPNAACIDTYLTGKAVKILRRPLTADELADARAVANAAGTYRANLTQVLATHLQLPSFLLRMELGAASDDAAIYPLTPYEVATRIAFATTDSTPDDILLTAAKNGALSAQTDVEAQVRRLFATARGKAKVRSMFRNWLLQVAGIDTSGLPAALTSGIQTSGLDNAIMDETDQFIDYIVWEKNAGYRDLLTSKVSLASHTGLATIYGHSPLAATRTAGGAVATFAGKRQGLLMRSSYLAGAKSRTSLVSRGVRLRRQVMCQDLPDPTPDAVAARNNLAPSEAQMVMMTNRQYITQITNSPVCLACHSQINPTGIAFENYDSLGRIRTTESIFDASGNFLRALPIDSSSTVPTWSGQTLPVADAYDLISQIANSQEGPACFARQSYRYFSQRKESLEDACSLNTIFGNLTKSNASILDSFVATVANTTTGVRRK